MPFLNLGFFDSSIQHIIRGGMMLRSHTSAASVVLLLVFLGRLLLAGWCLSCFGGFGRGQGLGRGEGLLGYLLLRVGRKSGGAARDVHVLTVVLAVLRVVARSKSRRGFACFWQKRGSIKGKRKEKAKGERETSRALEWLFSAQGLYLTQSLKNCIAVSSVTCFCVPIPPCIMCGVTLTHTIPHSA